MNFSDTFRKWNLRSLGCVLHELFLNNLSDEEGNWVNKWKYWKWKIRAKKRKGWKFLLRSLSHLEEKMTHSWKYELQYNFQIWGFNNCVIYNNSFFNWVGKGKSKLAFRCVSQMHYFFKEILEKKFYTLKAQTVYRENRRFVYIKTDKRNIILFSLVFGENVEEKFDAV